MRLSAGPRHRIVPTLAVLGVVAVGSACKQSAPRAPRAPRAPVVTEDSGVCALDEVRESFCAKKRASACSATGAGAEAIEAADVLPTTYLDSELARFSLDAKRSALKEETCCFTRCKLIEVCAVRHPAPNEPNTNTQVDGTYRLKEYCIGKPEAGTSVPAEANEACPAAVLFLGRGGRRDWWNAASRYSKESDGRCCYLVEFVSIPGRSS